ncbi:MAG: hypothetical protein Terrestrivirus1_79 [Terrestrivirus sp.]|uniref:Collagen-like protein n=1 Tax=Terrestrivirus sp. TaxID=2487775 RepID=A0A3G4ZK42_9VIRU|nr:MAG: hypothetical protein Terrestrivirus1_79 [Terrestrivirus sp.]
MNNQLKRRNSDDVICCRGPQGPRGVKGDPGASGASGPAGTSGIIGYAEYVQLSQDTNANLNTNIAFQLLTDNPTGIFNTIGITTANAATPTTGTQGTAFLLPVGIYIIDYQTMLDFNDEVSSNYIPMGIYTSTNNANGSYVLDNNSSTVTYLESWMSGRHIVKITVPTYLMLGSTGPDNVEVIDGDTGSFIVRMTFLKVA